MRHRAIPRIGAFAILLSMGPALVCAGDEEDDARFEAVASRYHQALKQRPYRGATFDLWYRHYLDAGRLDGLFALAEKAVESSSDDLPAQLILGLLYERKGRSEDAVRVYAAARKLAPRRYEAPALLGMLLFRLSRFEEAATALTEAVGNSPPQRELLELLKRLGQSYQRAGKIREAIATWSRITEEFPNDRRVLAELAELLDDEGQIDESMKRWEQVAALAAKDPHQQLTARLEIARLLARKEKFPEAQKQLVEALDRVEPENWLAQDIHRRIETLFTGRGDLPGLVVFYDERCRTRPDDLVAARQLAGALVRSGKLDEAVARYRATIAVAPRRRDLREALIGTLERAGRSADALAECRALIEAVPDDPDLLKRLGQLTLLAAPEDRRAEAEREAIAVWDRLARLRPEDAAAALQAAEVCRSASLKAANAKAGRDRTPDSTSPLVEAAETYYREAVRRSRGAAVPCEALGEFLHSRGRRREAVAAWSQIAAPPADTSANWRRLAEVLDHYEYLADARAASTKALAGEPDNIELHRLHMRLALKADDYDAALAEAAHLERLAERPRQVEQALLARVEVAQAAGTLEREIDRLMAASRHSPLSARDGWLLGLLAAQSGNARRAATVFQAAVARDPANLLLTRAAAEAYEAAGRRVDALKTYRGLAEREPSQAVAHLSKIASLELDVGSSGAAKTAAESLVQRRPGDPEGYLLRAEIAFQLGELNDGRAWLQRAVRAAPRDLSIRLELARAIERYGPAGEAPDHFWRCFELADNLEDKREVVGKLVALAQGSRTQDSLLQRLRQLRDAQSDPKPLTLCLVDALRTIGDLKGARAELEKAVASSPEDLGILKSLADLAAIQKDWTAAVSFQERIVAHSTDAAQLESLARYLQARGDTAAADRALLRLAESDEVDALADIIAQALDRADFTRGRRLAEMAVQSRPGSWRLRFLCGTAQLAMKDYPAAAASFEAVLAMPRDGRPSQASSRSTTPRPRPPRATTARAFPPQSAAGLLAQASGQTALSGLRQRPGALDEVPAGKLPDLDETRETLGSWQQWLTIDTTSYSPTAVRPARRIAVPGGVPSAGSGISSNQQQAAQQAMTQFMLAQQGRQTQMAPLTVAGTSARFLRSANQGFTAQSPPWRLARNQRSARQQSLMGLAAAQRRAGQDGEWLKRYREAAGSDRERRRSVVIAALALQRLDEARAVSIDLMKSHPEDAFPHIARLFVESFRPSWLDETHAEIRQSVEWLIARRPDLRRELTHGLLNVLITGTGRLDEALPLLNSAVAMADLESLPRLSRLAANLSDLAIQKAIHERAAELVADQPDVPGTSATLSVILAANAIFASDDAYLASILKLLDLCLECDEPAPLPAAPVPMQMQMVNQRQVATPLSTFPPPSPALDFQRLEALRSVYRRWDALGRVELLSQHLERRGESSTGRARYVHRLAAGVLKWWRGDRPGALAMFEQVSGEAPADLGVSLVAAHGYYQQREYARALAVLDKAPADTKAWTTDFDRLRTTITARLRVGTPDQVLDALMLVLKTRTHAPELGFLFTGSPRSPRIAARPATGTTVPVSTMQPGVMTPSGTTTVVATVPSAISRTRSLEEVLKQAQRRGILADLEQAAAAHWDRYPESAELGALVTLTRFQHDDIAGAKAAAERWGKLLGTRPDTAGAIESLRIISQCLDHEETRALGRELAREVLPQVRTRGMSPEVIELNLRVIQAMVTDNQKDAALEELRRFRESMVVPSRPTMIAK